MKFQIQTRQNYEVEGEQLAQKLEELKNAGAEIIRVLPISE
jgi:hypothetical protein